ncbi:GAF domain-containing protein [Scytonema sp. UIC 10036]|uniref:methyl-accepting chemotaxis protein n=1 Tax=Scytonema sp. UIC 10036 TaxID=2304196 RepID=UPI0012DA3D0D|nr:methyl-accepting chemotaxis protein [Scytonema sp. UIC 10036]MUG97200.1 GAF domain-containing protein [Scytonema sp. UIC 10036]
MFNKTNDAKDSLDAERNGVANNSSKIKDSNFEELDRDRNTELTVDSSLSRLSAPFKRLNLGTKATLLALAIGTLPVLAVGSLAYHVASLATGSKVAQTQQLEVNDMADKVNRFMLERYTDMQVLSTMPILTNPKLRDSLSPKEKQVLLDKYIESYKVYDSISIFNLNGDAIAQTQKASITNQNNKEFLEAVKDKGSTYISQPEVSKETGNGNIIIATPIKDSTTGKFSSVVIASMPVKSLDDLLKNYGVGHKYYLSDESGKLFLPMEKTYIGRDVKADFPGISQRQTISKEDTFTTVNKLEGKEQLVSYTSKIQEGLPDLKWQALLTTDAGIAFAPQRQLGLTIILGMGLAALIVGAIAVLLAKKITEPIVKATDAVAKLGQGDLGTRLEVESEDELGVLNANINQMAAQLQTLVKQQEQDTERAKSLAEITLRTRRSLNMEDIYKTAVREVRQAIKTDRVLIYHFNPETLDGDVVAESVTAGLPRMLGVQIDDPCFRERHIETYKDGRIRAISNIYQDPNLSNAQCYIKMLEKFAVKANLVAPIISDGQLIALMIAHHCDSPRIWLQSEIELFKQIAIQVGYALEQALLLQEVEKARSIAEKSSEDERRQKEALQMQLLELLSEVEGAASGDLTVRAEVTAGEIGTVADFFNSIVESLRDIVTQVKQAAIQVNQAIGENEGSIRHLAEEALAQASEINRSLDAVDNMTHSIQAVAASAQQAAVVANTAANTAKKSGIAMDMTVQNILHLRETVGETAKKVKRLGESTQQISRVVALINQISMQTNLLAINAGIEAARAGEEGQGFAVVAEEVGELAARSAAATKEIEQIVENIQRETTEVVQAMELGTTQVVEGTRIVEDAKQNLTQILDISRQIDLLVQSISQATASQVETSQTVSQLMREIASSSQRTSDSSRQVSESLQQTVEISQQLQATVGTFKVD